MVESYLASSEQQYVLMLVDDFVFYVFSIAREGSCTAGPFHFLGDSGYHLNFEGIALSFKYTLPLNEFFKSLGLKCREHTLFFFATRKSSPSSLLIACSNSLRLVFGRNIKIWCLRIVVPFVDFLIEFTHGAEWRHCRKLQRKHYKLAIPPNALRIGSLVFLLLVRDVRYFWRGCIDCHYSEVMCFIYVQIILI